MSITRSKEKTPKRINWKVLSNFPDDYCVYLLSAEAKKEIDKMEKYLSVFTDKEFGTTSLHLLTRRLASTPIAFDIVVGYFLKRLGGPVFILPSSSPHVKMNNIDILDIERLLGNVLDLIDSLGFRKAAAILLVKPKKDDHKDKLESTT